MTDDGVADDMAVDDGVAGNGVANDGNDIVQLCGYCEGDGVVVRATHVSTVKQ